MEALPVNNTAPQMDLKAMRVLPAFEGAAGEQMKFEVQEPMEANRETFGQIKKVDIHKNLKYNPELVGPGGKRAVALP